MYRHIAAGKESRYRWGKTHSDDADGGDNADGSDEQLVLVAGPRLGGTGRCEDKAVEMVGCIQTSTTGAGTRIRYDGVVESSWRQGRTARMRTRLNGHGGLVWVWGWRDVLFVCFCMC